LGNSVIHLNRVDGFGGGGFPLQGDWVEIGTVPRKPEGWGARPGSVAAGSMRARAFAGRTALAGSSTGLGWRGDRRSHERRYGGDGVGGGGHRAGARPPATARRSATRSAGRSWFR